MAKDEDPAAPVGEAAIPDLSATDALTKAERKAAKAAKKAAKREREMAEAAAADASRKAAKAAKKAAKAAERDRLAAEAAAAKALKKVARAEKKAAKADDASVAPAPATRANATDAVSDAPRAKAPKAKAKAKAAAPSDAAVKQPKADKADKAPKAAKKSKREKDDARITDRVGGAAVAAGSILEEVAGLVRQVAEPAAARIVERIKDPGAPTPVIDDEAARLEAEREEAERLAAELAEAERQEAERRAAERKEAERLAAERERIAAEEAEAARLEAERAEQERLEAERAEQERLEAERAEQERLEAERAEAERLEQERLAAERAEQERLEQERIEAERLEAERIEAERIEAERLEAERVEQERLEAERVEQERLEAERLELERIEAERLEGERLEQERLAAERAEQERLEVERLEVERLKTERLAAEQAEAERLEQERLEQERIAATLAAAAAPEVTETPAAGGEPAYLADSDADAMPLALDQAPADETAERPAEAEAAVEDEVDESVAARLAALGLLAGGAAVAAGGAAASGVAEAAEHIRQGDDADDSTAVAEAEAQPEAESESTPTTIDFRPSLAPAPTDETRDAAPWPEAEFATPVAPTEPEDAATTLVVETVEIAPDRAESDAAAAAEAVAIAEAVEADAAAEPRPEIIPLPATVVAATVDVGANSAHLLVAAVTGHRVEALYDESAFLGLGERVATHGYLGSDARDELVATLAGYADAARSLGATSVTFLGTEPVRRAADAAPLVHAVEGRANVPLHVLDHDEEAKLNLLGVTGGKKIEAELLVIDIGGGSSEFVLVGPDRPLIATGIRIGSAVLTKEHSKSDPPSLKEIEAMRQAAKAAIAGAPDARPSEVVAVGGTASNLLKLLPATAVDRMLTRRRITVALAMLTVQRSAEAAERHALRPQRARVLPAGALIVDAILERYGVERLRVCDEGIREGAVIAAAKAGAEWRDRLTSLVAGWEDGSSRN